jgi:hypothetical protein
VRVLECRGGLDLDYEAFGTEDGGEFGLEDLDRDLAVVLQVLGEIHRGHGTALPTSFDPTAFDPRRVRFDDPKARWDTAFREDILAERDGPMLWRG